MDLKYKKAKEKLLNGTADKSCKEIFRSGEYPLEYAYYELFCNNGEMAQRIFSKYADKDIRAHWGVFFSAMCTGKIYGYPSYFELRNFYEIDLNLLLVYYRGEYVEEICKYISWLKSINSEVYKFTGRAFLKNSYLDLGLFFLEKGLDYFYNDPELHFLLAEFYLLENNTANVEKYTKSCLEILPEYYPAIKLRNELNI